MKFTNLIEDVQNLGENMDAFSWINRSFVERASLFKVKTSQAYITTQKQLNSSIYLAVNSYDQALSSPLVKLHSCQGFETGSIEVLTQERTPRYSRSRRKDKNIKINSLPSSSSFLSRRKYCILSPKTEKFRQNGDLQNGDVARQSRTGSHRGLIFEQRMLSSFQSSLQPGELT